MHGESRIVFQAARLFKLAGDQDDYRTGRLLGEFYENGRFGLPVDEQSLEESRLRLI